MNDYELSHLPIYVPYSLQMDSLQVLPKQKKKKRKQKKKKRSRATKLTLFHNPATSFPSLDAERSHSWPLCKCTTGEDHTSMELDFFYSRGIAYVLLWSLSLSETLCLPNPLLSSEHSRLVDVVRAWYNGHWRYSSSSFAFLPVLRG